MEESKKINIDFFKVLTGIASGSILLIINFIPEDFMKILSASQPCKILILKILILVSLLSFTISVGIGILAMRKVINTYREEKMKFGKYTLCMIIMFFM